MDEIEVKQFKSLGWTKDDFEVELAKRWREDALLKVGAYISLGSLVFAAVLVAL